jgi:hypothetical protein
MSEAPKLVAIHGGPNAEHPPWREADEKELRDTLEELLRESDHVLVMGVTRLPDGKTKQVHSRCMRGNRTSFWEMIGHLQQVIHNWMQE